MLSLEDYRKRRRILWSKGGVKKPFLIEVARNFPMKTIACCLPLCFISRGVYCWWCQFILPLSIPPFSYFPEIIAGVLTIQVMVACVSTVLNVTVSFYNLLHRYALSDISISSTTFNSLIMLISVTLAAVLDMGTLAKTDLSCPAWGH